YYSNEEIKREVKRPVVAALLKLFTYRNRSKAFELEGKFEITTPAKHRFNIKRTSADGQTVSELKVDLETFSYEVKENGQKITF
ncbi:MAG: sucrose phosphorylase, partial [Ligilactobacillus sp.]|nr:sucrose phosphorylase [Ligilactobacillus sp.]